jgi:hypothetical protein
MHLDGVHCGNLDRRALPAIEMGRRLRPEGTLVRRIYGCCTRALDCQVPAIDD